ncbi:MAG: hypothetical protein KQH67_10580 [Bacteroidetes bacterium]|nr:hypothetical protein [Bacteroidota bacterium]
MTEKKTVNIFWTGGWDSTFRLLQLLVVEKKTVQPHYIIDPTRKSTDAEIRAMNGIRLKMLQKFPFTEELLLPTIIVELEEVDKENLLLPNFERLTKSVELGGQYAWLASYCEEAGIYDMELSIQRPGRMHDLINREMKFVADGNDKVRVVDVKTKFKDLYTLLKYYRFPIINLTKTAMIPIAEKAGFRDLMDLTWFCHNPRTNNSPCGICGPCITAIRQGMGKKVSFSGHVRYQLIVRTGLKKLKMKRAG